MASVEFKGVTCIKETAMAILCKIEGKECWVPKSQINDDSEVNEEDDEGMLSLSEWFATKAGLV